MTSAQALKTILSRLEAPLVLIDVGARWGTPKQWDALTDHAQIIGFEPDLIEVERLNAQAPPNVTYLPVALGETSSTSTNLYMTQQPACSSIYPPIATLYEQYPALSEIRPERIMEVTTHSLDNVLSLRGIPAIDAIKLDTQGSELDILRGSRGALKNCSMIDVEVEFNPIYQGQPLFCDVDRFLRDEGFVLWRLSDICHYATGDDQYPPLNLMVAFSPPQEIHNLPVRGGQIFWAQAQYVRAEFPRTGASRLPQKDAIKAAAIVASAGFWDLALEILAKGDRGLAEEISSS
jgi:FkbM family methyltransferase